MTTEAPTLTDVSVMRTDLNTPQLLKIREDRYRDFIIAASHDAPDMPDRTDWHTGAFGIAVTGLSTLFPHIPIKFPILDIFRFLQNANSYRPLNLAQVEYLLSVFGQTYPQIMGNGEDVQ